MTCVAITTITLETFAEWSVIATSTKLMGMTLTMINGIVIGVGLYARVIPYT